MECMALLSGTDLCTKVAYATTQARKGLFIHDVLPRQQFVTERRFAKTIDASQMLLFFFFFFFF